jgi:hypothetical protein
MILNRSDHHLQLHLWWEGLIDAASTVPQLVSVYDLGPAVQL